MKTCVALMLMVILSLSVLFADTGDKAVNYVLSQGSFESAADQLYFNHLACAQKENLPAQKEAYLFMAQTAYVFLLVETGLVEYDVNEAARIKEVDFISCPVEGAPQNQLGMVSMASIRELVCNSKLESLGDPECFGLIYGYVSEHALNN